MNECTDSFEDSHTSPNLRSDSHSQLFPLVPAASIAIIALRGSWPWGPETLLAPPQALELISARTGKAISCQYLCWRSLRTQLATPHDTITNNSIITVSFTSFRLIRMRNSTTHQVIFDICRRLHLPSQPSRFPELYEPPTQELS
jgi:hypothetical protein